jgi:hypothetical protein
MYIIVGFILLLLLSWGIYYHAENYCELELGEFEKLIAIILMMFGILLIPIAIFQKLL